MVTLRWLLRWFMRGFKRSKNQWYRDRCVVTALLLNDFQLLPIVPAENSFVFASRNEESFIVLYHNFSWFLVSINAANERGEYGYTQALF